MKLCPNCNHENPGDLDICLNCAAVLGQHCPNCSHLVPSRSKFCNECGTRLDPGGSSSGQPAHRHHGLQSLRNLMPAALAEKVKAATAQIAGERREVTVLFLDVANFTAISQTLGSENVYLLVDEAMQLLVKAVYKYEGTIDKFTGDGLMALFGAPVAHENDPERAVRAAMDMLRELKPFQKAVQREHGVEFQVRIGLNTGPVIAAEVGSDLHMEYTVLGDTVNVASRLETAAEPSTILVSFETYQRTRPLFRYQTLAPLTVKGISAPIQAFQLVSIREQPGQLRGLPGLRVALIGRADDLACLRHTLAEVQRDQQRRVVMITGEAGLGKSRLVAEFQASLDPAGIQIYQGGCQAYARSRPLWVVADMLRDIICISENDPQDLQHEVLRNYLSRLGVTQDEVLPYLCHALGLGQPDPQLDVRLRLLDATILQRQTHAALRQVLLAEARLKPAILVFEDLHWIDPASRDFLTVLLQTTVDVPLLVMLVTRDVGEDNPFYGTIEAGDKEQKRWVNVHLQALSKTECQLLVDQLIDDTTSEAQRLKRRIVERAEGNPFYAEEIVRMLADQGGLTRAQENSAWQVTSQLEAELEEVPGTLKGLVLARFDRIPDHLRRVLQKAAMIGASFPVGLLETLLDASLETSEAYLFELEARQFLVSEPAGKGRVYTFRHVLILDVIYGTLLNRDRRQLHQHLARALEQEMFWPPDEQTEALAHHYLRSAEPARAIPYLITAAENAGWHYANETAVKHYRRVLELLRAQPTLDNDRLLQVRIGLGRALKFAGQFIEASQELAEALDDLVPYSLKVESDSLVPILVEGLLELADIRSRAGAPDVALTHLEAARVALGETGQREQPNLWRSLIDRMAWVHFRQGNLDEAFSLASSVPLDLESEKIEDPITQASLYNTLGGIFWQWGNLAEATAYVGRSLKLYESMRYAWGTAIAHTNLGVLYFGQGLWPQAASSFEKAYQIRRENGYMPEQALNLYNLGMLRMAMGEHEPAQRDFEASLAISQQLGDDFGSLLAQLGLVHLAVIQQRFEEAAQHIEAAQGLIAAAGEDQAVQLQWLMALVQAERDDLATATRTATDALQKAVGSNLTETEADCRRVLGILRARAGAWEEAEALLREAVDLCLQQHDSYRHGLALMELGHLYRRLAGADTLSRAEWEAKARATLQDAAGNFEKLGAAYDLAQVRDVLGRLQTGTAPGTAAGERRRATILWLDLDPAPGISDEEVLEGLALTVPALVAVAKEYQGQVKRHRTGLTVAFGVPTAHEDDPERAVQTAWQILQALLTTSEPTQVSFRARLGISRGPVVAGRQAYGEQSELVITGAPMTEAQHLAQRVPADKIWVSDAVYAATKRLFVFEKCADADQDAGPPIWQLVELKQQPDPARGLAGVKTRLIGRAVPLKQMISLSRHLQHGLGGLIWLEGEAGIGKSRLMREFTRVMAPKGVPVWAGQCSSQRTNHAFSLFTSLLGQIFSIQPTDTPLQIRAKIDKTIQVWPKSVLSTRPYLELLVGLRPGGLDGERLANLEPEQLRQQSFVALRRLLKSLANEQPLMILLDDLHWIDPISAELLLFLSYMVASTPILFVCARRNDGTETLNDRLAQVQSLLANQTVQLTLERLSRSESEMLLEELLPGSELPASLQTTIVRKSEGNPYYIEEFVRMLIEEGHLRKRQGLWQVDPGLDPAWLPLPTSLEALIRSRVDALPPEAKQLLQCAAVIGSPVEEGLLAALSGMSTTGAVLSLLQKRGLLQRATESNHWEFGHYLAEDVVYEAILQARRKELHLRVGQELEVRGEDSGKAQAEELAHHFSRAEDNARALDYLVLAGERAAARSANEEAQRHFEQAAQLMVHQPDASDMLRWRVYVGLGDVYRLMGQYEDSTASLQAGLPLADNGNLSTVEQAGLYRRLGETALKLGQLDIAQENFLAALDILNQPEQPAPSAEMARILTRLAWTDFLQGQSEEAEQRVQAALEAAQPTGSLNELAMAENLLGGIYHRQGEWQAASHHTMRAMVLREQMGYTWGVAGSLSNLGILAVSAGQWHKARSYFERSLALRHEMGDVEGVAIVHNNLGTLVRDQGDLDQAEHHFRESMTVAHHLDLGYHLANSTLGLAHVLLLKGKLDKAEEALAASLTQAETRGGQELLPEMYRVQAEILLARTEWAQASAAAETSTGLAAEAGNRSQEAAAWRLAADIALSQDQIQTARTLIGKARQALAEVTDELEAGRVEAQAGRINQRLGQTTQADQDFRVAKEIFLRLGASLDLKQVEEASQRRPEPEAS